MSEEPKDGGPAFPHGPIPTGRGNESVTYHGMSMRDWFAGQAPEAPHWWMPDGCPTPPPGWKEGDGPSAWNDACNRWAMMRLASWRYAYADAMLEARK